MDQVSLELKRGQSKTYPLEFTDENNVAIDITGYSVYFIVKEKIDDVDASAKINKTITSHTDPTDGKTQLQLTSTDTDLLGNYIFEIWYKNTTNEKVPMLEGVITFQKSAKQTFA